MIDTLKFEKELLESGYHLIAGIDEVGRGPMAGPVVTCCIIMKEKSHILGVNDSKTLSSKKRQMLKEQILKECICYHVSFISEKIIDEINIYEATKLSMLDSINNCAIKPEFCLIDAMPLDLDIPHKSIIKGDRLSYSIACASIIAKEARDDYMRELSKIYPEYGFEKHMGYCTKGHIQAVEKYGVLDIHRKSFSPIKKILEKEIINDLNK